MASPIQSSDDELSVPTEDVREEEGSDAGQEKDPLEAQGPEAEDQEARSRKGSTSTESSAGKGNRTSLLSSDSEEEHKEKSHRFAKERNESPTGRVSRQEEVSGKGPSGRALADTTCFGCGEKKVTSGRIVQIDREILPRERSRYPEPLLDIGSGSYRDFLDIDLVKTANPLLTIREGLVVPAGTEVSMTIGNVPKGEAVLWGNRPEVPDQIVEGSGEGKAVDDKDLTQTPVFTHDIELLDDRPIRQKTRHIPFGLRNEFRKTLDEMLSKGVAEPSSSPYASPVVLVKKKDAGYWQIPLTEKAKEVTAFTTSEATSPPTFQRMMEIVLKDLIRDGGVRVIHAVRKFHQFIYGIGATRGELSPKVMRWALDVQRYQINLEYVKGKANVVADALSRGPTQILEIDPNDQDYVVAAVKLELDRTEDEQMEWTRACQGCFLANPHLKLTPPLKPIEANKPLQLVGVDIADIGPSHNGNRTVGKGVSPEFVLSVVKLPPSLGSPQNRTSRQTPAQKGASTSITLAQMLEPEWECAPVTNIRAGQVLLHKISCGGHALSDFLEIGHDLPKVPIRSPWKLAQMYEIFVQGRQLAQAVDIITTNRLLLVEPSILRLVHAYRAFASQCPAFGELLTAQTITTASLAARTETMKIVIEEVYRQGPTTTKRQVLSRDVDMSGRQVLFLPSNYGSSHKFALDRWQWRRIKRTGEAAALLKKMRLEDKVPIRALIAVVSPEWDLGETDYFVSELRELAETGADVAVVAGEAECTGRWSYLGAVRKALQVKDRRGLIVTSFPTSENAAEEQKLGPHMVFLDWHLNNRLGIKRACFCDENAFPRLSISLHSCEQPRCTTTQGVNQGTRKRPRRGGQN
ncbi:unnamed protein product [Caenorhabditis auriculariae]|uniref:Reverse transcriptase RNase H-like domain-containing protein n=1 Tax=Caenorhabditis auriculariae TaxID=2777116 RepID=A0A8S1H6R4_9PELO|nr:unnamed protein product [Caenorhabditis auriculariae]